MKFVETGFDGLLLIEPVRSVDERGHFARTFCRGEFAERGLATEFPQCGTAFNRVAGTVRGMHYQKAPHQEIKLIRCTRGAILDVVVDLRPASATYLRSYAAELSQENGHQFYVAKGFAHGYQTLVDDTEVHYMISTDYEPACASGVRWDDPAISVRWPLPIAVVSERDRNWPKLDPFGPSVDPE